MLLGLIVYVLNFEFTLPPPMTIELAYINQTRIENKLKPLAPKHGLNASAKEKCEHMVKFDYWAHNGGDKQWSDMLFEHNPDVPFGGEILAMGYRSLEAQHTGWMHSPPHYATIVDSRYNVFGSASCYYTNGLLLTVVHFGTQEGR